MDTILIILVVCAVFYFIAANRNKSVGSFRPALSKKFSGKIAPENLFAIILQWGEYSKYIISDIDEKNLKVVLQDKPNAWSGPGYLYLIELFGTVDGSKISIGIKPKVGIDITSAQNNRLNEICTSLKTFLIIHGTK